MGLPGAGKSTVAPALAERLGWNCVDVDTEIERAAGMSVVELFRTEGEAAFRAMEFRLTAALSSHSEVVLAPGAGWAAQPGSLEALADGTAVVWLRTRPERALERLRAAVADRPLLAAADPLETLRGLERQRNERYARADLVVDVDDRTVPEIVDTITTWLARSTS